MTWEWSGPELDKIEGTIDDNVKDTFDDEGDNTSNDEVCVVDGSELSARVFMISRFYSAREFNGLILV